MTTRWTCPRCGTEEPDVPLCFGADAPWREIGVREEELASRAEMTRDWCVVDQKHFFLRGHICLPIRARAETFEWSVWCSLSEKSFVRTMERWDAPDREHDEPCFGWLMTELPLYPSTLHIKTMVHSRAPGLVPLIELEPPDHPLAVEQREGITMERVAEIAHELLGHLDT